MINTNVLWILLFAFLNDVRTTPLPEVTAILQNTSLRSQGDNSTLTGPTTPPGAKPDTTPSLGVTNTPPNPPKPFLTFPWPTRNFNVLVTFVNLTQNLPMMVLDGTYAEDFRNLIAKKLEVDVECISNISDIHFTYGGKPMKINKRSADLSPNNDITVQFGVTTDKYENCEILREKLNSSGPLKLSGKTFYPSIVVWEDGSTYESPPSQMQTSKSATDLLSANKFINISTSELSSKTQTSYSKYSNLLHTKLETAEQTDRISTARTSGKPLRHSTPGIFQTNVQTKAPAHPTKSSNDDKRNNFSLADGNHGDIILIYLLMLLLLIPVILSIAIGVYCCVRTSKKKKLEHLHPTERLKTSNFYQPPLGDRPPSYRTNTWSIVRNAMDAVAKESLDQRKQEQTFYDNRSSTDSSYSRNSYVNNFQQDADENF